MKKLAGLLLMISMTTSAYAAGGGGGSNWLCQVELWLGIVSTCSSGDGGKHHHSPVPAPEIDPASAVSALTLLAGGLAVLRGRRRS